MKSILNMKIPRNIQVNYKDVTLGDIAKFECTDKVVINRIKTIKILRIPDCKHNRFVFSVLKVMELIHQVYPDLEINNMGEIDFIIDYEIPRKQSKIFSAFKLIMVCLTVSMGAGFAIMTFNNDVGVALVFKQLYKLIVGTESEGYMVMELTYSIGIFLGIIIFFNHFGAKKITTDPTPIEVEMRLYEDNINTTLIEGVNRKQTHIEVE